MSLNIIKFEKTGVFKLPLWAIVLMFLFTEAVFISVPSYGQANPEPGVASDQAAPIAKAGDVEAQRILGERLITGWDIAKDTVEGLKLLEAAIAAGDVRANAILGKFYVDGYYLPRDTKKGIALLEQAAAAEDVDALATLGQVYLWGSGAPADPSKALDFLRRGTVAGSVEARRILGEQLITGWVLAKKPAEGQKLLEAAIAAGDIRAKVVLGKLYVDGRYLPRDNKRGMALLESAAAVKNADAITKLGLVYLTGNDVTKADPAKALDYLQRGVDAGNKEAQRRLGEALITGSGVVRKPLEGRKLLEAAGKNGDAKSLVTLGRLLMEGQYLKTDLPRAQSLFEKAAQLGDVEGIELLGRKLMWSQRSKTDANLAEKYLTMAGKAGRGPAWTTLAQGAIYGKLGKGSAAKYPVFLKNARRLGETKIEIVEAERWTWGLAGAKANASKTISTLETAAAAGNQDAIKYLISLLRDGNGWNIKRNIKKAQAYLDKYGSKLAQADQHQQAILLKVARTNSLSAFAQLSEKIDANPDFVSAEFHKQLFRTNQNFSVYLLQAELKERKIYTGSLNGKATARTISAIRSACDALQGKAKCKGKILSEGVIVQVIMN